MNYSTNNGDNAEKKKTLCLNNTSLDIAKQKINKVLSGKQQNALFNFRDVRARDNNTDNRSVLTREEEDRRAVACATNLRKSRENKNINRKIGLESVYDFAEDFISNTDISTKADISEVEAEENNKEQKGAIILNNDITGVNHHEEPEKKDKLEIHEIPKIQIPVEIDEISDAKKDIITIKKDVKDVKDIKIDTTTNDNIRESVPSNGSSYTNLHVKQKTGDVSASSTPTPTPTANANIWMSKKNKRNDVSSNNTNNSHSNSNYNNSSFSKGYSNRKKKRSTKMCVSNIKKEIVLDDFALTLRDFAVKLSASKKDLHNVLTSIGLECADNEYLSNEMIELIAYEFGTSIIRKNQDSIKDEIFNISNLSDSDFCIRPPIVTIMGHVDHGKTTLLDSLRDSSVVSKESGGITQHIGAYQINSKISGCVITFIDTPGHEAFTSMRIRGAQITDIVVLVVAADDGVKEQTIEAINHALASKVRIIVAINKIDKPDTNIEKLKGDLLQHGIVLESYGGDIQCIEVSAKDRINLHDLEEAILLEASMIDLRVPKNFRASGVVLESKLDKKIGNVATFLLKQGTMKVLDLFFVGKSSHGKVKSMKSFDGSSLKVAFPSMPVEITGLSSIPIPGDEFFVYDDEKQLKRLLNEATNVQQIDKKDKNSDTDTEKPSLTLDMIFGETESKEIKILVKADMRGSLEAIIESINKMSTDDIDIKILHQGVGSVTQSDLVLAKASDAIIFAFRVKVDCKDKSFDNVKVFSIDVIYSLTEELEKIILGMNKVVLEDEVIAVAEVKQVFNFDKVGIVAGCFIKTGNFLVGAKAKLYRDSKLVYTGKISSLRRFKDVVKEVKAGFECGVILDKFSDVKPNDVIETFKSVQ